MKKAVKINEEAQKLDGIEKIKDDGTVVFTEKAVAIMDWDRRRGTPTRKLRFA